MNENLHIFWYSIYKLFIRNEISAIAKKKKALTISKKSLYKMHTTNGFHN